MLPPERDARLRIAAFALVITLILLVGFSKAIAQTPINVLYYIGLEIVPPSDGDSQRLVSLGMNVTTTTDPNDLNPANMNAYDVVVLWHVASGVITSSKTALEDYVRGGKGLFVHTPGGVGVIDYLPTGFEVTVLSQEICNPMSTLDTEMCVVAPSDPIVAGFDGFDLSYAAIQIDSIGSSYSLLAENCLCQDPSLAVGTLDAGRIVFDTGFFASTTLFPGNDDYVIGLFDYLAGSGVVQTIRQSWGSLKSQF